MMIYLVNIGMNMIFGAGVPYLHEGGIIGIGISLVIIAVAALNLIIDFDQFEKVYAGIISEFSEVIWFYPSNTNSLANGGTGENDRYVIYNYSENIWYYGDLGKK